MVTLQSAPVVTGNPYTFLQPDLTMFFCVLQDCCVATCKTITCNVSSLELHQPIEFKIKGDISSGWLSEVWRHLLRLYWVRKQDREVPFVV